MNTSSDLGKQDKMDFNSDKELTSWGWVDYKELCDKNKVALEDAWRNLMTKFSPLQQQTTTQPIQYQQPIEVVGGGSKNKKNKRHTKKDKTML
jgi:hypothetical protein